MSATRHPIWSRPPIVAAAYLAAALLLTWPLVTVMHRRIAGDMGDPLFNCWVLLWTSGQLLRALGGDWSALSHYWSGNIFYPAPLTLTYSEHLTPQMLQVLPVLAATHNVILGYNLLLLGTYVLSGLGMYLLVRELTCRPLAAFLAGLAFAFAPYRLDQYGHLEVLSSQWMPFTLYGLRRYFVTRRLRPLAGGAGALVAQSLSCGYYLAYFPPFVVAYCLYEMGARGRFRDLCAWRALVGTGAAVLLIVGVFLWPYFKVRQIGDVGVRSPSEVLAYSADTRGFVTVSEHSKLLVSRVRAMPRSENQGFPGFAILGLSAVALAAAWMSAAAHARVSGGTAWWRRGLVVAVGILFVAQLVSLGHLVFTGRTAFGIAGVTVRHSPAPLVFQTIVALAALLLVSPTCRRAARGTRGSVVGFFGCAAVAAAWMSLGPEMHANGRTVGPGLYRLFYRWVPGFDGLRVVSLHFMIVALFLAVLAGLGAAALISRWPVAGRIAASPGMVAIAAESWSVPTETNIRPLVPGFVRPPVEIAREPDLYPSYRLIRDLPAGTVVAEFPFGEIGFEVLYVFYSGYHRQPLLNGYSGFFPARYQQLVERLAHVPADPAGWTALRASGATHALVHEGLFLHGDGEKVSAWLRRHGAREVAADRGDRVFQLR
ncbi:MAG: hypothetical protein HY047_05520 [Acidobacteria bacterium]|nr:hypothetical protein [Acidobacteriota bacterium]